MSRSPRMSVGRPSPAVVRVISSTAPVKPRMRRDALVQQDGRQDEGEDGHRGQLDGGVDGRGETQAHDVAALGQSEAKEARPGNLRQVATLHPLLRHDERPQPEDDRRPDDTECHQLRPRDAAAGKHVLGERRHQPEQHHGQQHRPMRPIIPMISIFAIGFHEKRLKRLMISTFQATKLQQSGKPYGYFFFFPRSHHLFQNRKIAKIFVKLNFLI